MTQYAHQPPSSSFTVLPPANKQNKKNVQMMLWRMIMTTGGLLIIYNTFGKH